MTSGLSVDAVIACNPRRADLPFADVIYSHGQPDSQEPLASIRKKSDGSLIGLITFL